MRDRGTPIGKAIAAFFARHYMKLVALAVFFGLWQFAVSVLGIKQFIIPSPVATFSTLFVRDIAQRYDWVLHIRTTLSEVLISFAVTAVIGILVALLITWSAALRTIFTPVLTLLNSLPKIAFAPLFLIWFGYGLVPNVIIAVLIAFFPVIVNTATGLNAVEEDLLDLVRYLHASKLQVFVKIRIPNSLPYIFSGLKISTTLCVVGAIVGEFVASARGLGYLLKDAQAMIDTPPMFASLILISILGLSLFAVISILERVAMPWQLREAES
jgi:NitT/TauT family transport system permease protein